MKNKIEDLRNHLFATIEALSDKEDPMPIERAKAIADVGQVIVNSAKVEVAFMNAVGKGNGTGFIPIEEKLVPPAQAFGTPGQPRLVKGSASE